MTIAQETPMDAARRLAAGALRNGFRFEALHTYTSLEAKPLYWRIRAKHPATGKKWIRPMKLTGNGYELREREKPANGKPLYRVHELASRLDDVVILTEATAADVLALACEQDPGIAPGDDGAKVAGSAVQADAPAQAADDPPNTCRYSGGRFELTQRGVLFTGTDHEGNQKAPVWVCSPLGVIAKTRDSKSGEWGRLLEWFDDDDVRHQWAMPLELLEGDGTDVRRELARLGLHIATGRSARDLLAAYIKVWPVDQRARCVARLGWHGAVYTLPSAPTAFPADIEPGGLPTAARVLRERRRSRGRKRFQLQWQI